MEIITSDSMQRRRERFRSAFALLFNPTPNGLDTVVSHGLDGRFGLAAKVGGVVATSAAQGLKQGLPLGLGAIATAKGVVELYHPDGKQGVGLETTLVAQKMEFHQQLVDQAAVERSDHMGEGAMKGAFAVGNGEGFAHAGMGSRLAQRP
jgi:hypothetical protein